MEKYFEFSDVKPWWNKVLQNYDLSQELFQLSNYQVA